MTKINSGKTNSVASNQKEMKKAAEHELTEEADVQAQIYSIAILLTGCADDAQQVVEEVTFALQAEQPENNETLETRVHRLTYDSALLKLLNQVNTRSSKLEEATNKILNTSNYLA